METLGANLVPAQFGPKKISVSAEVWAPTRGAPTEIFILKILNLMTLLPIK